MENTQYIFNKLNYFCLPILRVLKLFNINIFYLSLSAKTSEKKEILAAKLKKMQILPLPLEFEKKLPNDALAFYDSDPNEQIYSSNLQLLNDNQLKKISKIFCQNEDLSPILRLVLQERLWPKNGELTKIQIWKKNNINKKIIFITFESLFFLKPINYQLKMNIVYIPLDLISMLLEILKLFSYSFLRLKFKKTGKLKVKNTDEKKIIFVLHKGTTYANLYDKKLFYSEDENSPFNQKKIIHLDYFNSNIADNLRCLKINLKSKLKIKYFIKIIINFLKHIYIVKNRKNLLGLLLILNEYRKFLIFLNHLEKLKNVKGAIIDYDILCSKALIIAFKFLKISTYAAQERFIHPHFTSFANVVVDNYFAVSTFAADTLKKSKYNYIKTILPYGQWRSDEFKKIKKDDMPDEVLEAKNKGKKIITALGYQCSDTWFDSNVDIITNWSCNRSFIEDMIKLSEELKNTQIILRYKNLEWLKLPYFADLIKKINEKKNLIISTNYKAFFHSYKLCKNSDLIIAKHTSIADECLSYKYPVLFYDYGHNYIGNIVSTFNYKSSAIICNNYQQLLFKAKSHLEDNENTLNQEIEKVHTDFFQTEGKGLVKNKIFNILNRI